MRTEVKTFEIRDNATFIPAMAVRFENEGGIEYDDWLLSRAGFEPDRKPPAVYLIHLNSGEGRSDPYEWGSGSRTMPAAHEWIEEHWDELRSGQVIDVRVALGERTTPVETERV
jgi:hypothetical protein